MKDFSFIFVLFILSCTSTKNITVDNVIGTYESNIFGCSELMTLKSDSTFLFKWSGGLIFGETTGSWQIVKNKIILNSERQPIKDPIDYKVTKLRVRDSDSIFISVQVEETKNPMPLAICSLKRKNIVLAETTTNALGETKLPISNADSIIISYVGFKPIRCSINSEHFNTYFFYMKPIDEYYRYFTSEKWNFSKGSLIVPNTKMKLILKKN